jgi:CheY-like chemotaxis protein
MSILLVDDDLENLWSLQLLLESSGHHVVLAENGFDALRKLAFQPAKLVVTDWQMPEMDGIELCRRLRNQSAYATVPIILLSGASEPTDCPRCWSVFFHKPVDLESLICLIETYLARRLAAP